MPSLADMRTKAKEAGLINLKGYRTTGGIRASLYNGTSQEGADALAEFMLQFERRV